VERVHALGDVGARGGEHQDEGDAQGERRLGRGAQGGAVLTGEGATSSDRHRPHDHGRSPVELLDAGPYRAVHQSADRGGDRGSDGHRPMLRTGGTRRHDRCWQPGHDAWWPRGQPRDRPGPMGVGRPVCPVRLRSMNSRAGHAHIRATGVPSRPTAVPPCSVAGRLRFVGDIVRKQVIPRGSSEWIPGLHLPGGGIRLTPMTVSAQGGRVDGGNGFAAIAGCALVVLAVRPRALPEVPVWLARV